MLVLCFSVYFGLNPWQYGKPVNDRKEELTAGSGHLALS